eukprot:scaffold4000_cov217-Chaetoceros_neogracile.AAC.1
MKEALYYSASSTGGSTYFVLQQPTCWPGAAGRGATSPARPRPFSISRLLSSGMAANAITG